MTWVWQSLQVVEFAIELRAWGGVQVFPDQIDQLMSVLARSWHPNRPRPVVVHVGQLVGQPLDGVRRQGRRLFDHHKVGWSHCPLADGLWYQEKVLELEPGDGVIEYSSSRRVIEPSVGRHVEQASVDPLLDNDEGEARRVRFSRSRGAPTGRAASSGRLAD